MRVVSRNARSRPIAQKRTRAVASVFRCTAMGALWVCRAVALRLLPTIQSEYRVQSTPAAAAAAVRASSSSRRSPPKSRNEVNSSHNTETHIQIHPETTGGDGKHPAREEKASGTLSVASKDAAKFRSFGCNSSNSSRSISMRRTWCSCLSSSQTRQPRAAWYT